VASARARALTAIATGEARVIVASAPALLPRLVPPSMLASATVELRNGIEIDPQILAEQLLEAGYTREDPVDEHGEFFIRGGIVDLFPPGDAEPIRVEFHRRHRGVDAAVRPVDAALDRHHRPGAHRPDS
jgi:transcription-repair coupling factor (superfamily II helicase)